MDLSFWQKQSLDTPLFPDILWTRPETAATSGKIAIIGGHSHGFGAPGSAYSEAKNAGIGICKVLLPDAVKKTVRHMLPDADYAPSNPSGSFSKPALTELLSIANWSDATLLAGDFGRNSETAVMLENFVQKYQGQLCVTQDAVDYFKALPRLLLAREDTLVALSLAQLQKFFIHIPLITPITYGMTPMQLAEALRDLTEKFPACIITKHNDQIYVASNGRVVSMESTMMLWRVKVAARASVFWLQNPTKQFEAVVSSLVQY